jgi:hypothetical protein
MDTDAPYRYEAAAHPSGARKRFITAPSILDENFQPEGICAMTYIQIK